MKTRHCCSQMGVSSPELERLDRGSPLGRCAGCQALGCRAGRQYDRPGDSRRWPARWRQALEARRGGAHHRDGDRQDMSTKLVFLKLGRLTDHGERPAAYPPPGCLAAPGARNRRSPRTGPRPANLARARLGLIRARPGQPVSHPPGGEISPGMARVRRSLAPGSRIEPPGDGGAWKTPVSRRSHSLLQPQLLPEQGKVVAWNLEPLRPPLRRDYYP